MPRFIWREKKWYLAVIALLCGAWTAKANPPPISSDPPGTAKAAAGSTHANPMDGPIRLIADASQVYLRVQDYSCQFVKTENINGRLQRENIIEMNVRNQPFSVSMRWLSPKSLAGQEACYVDRRNNGMMRVRLNGLGGAVGFMSIDLRDPRALENSRHAITEVGIGKLVERLGKDWELERRLNMTQVRIADYEFAKRRCTRVETIHPDNPGGQFYSFRSVVYFDKETQLPIRFEAYDWPRRGGPTEGELLESYSYINLHFNVGLGDETFRR